MKLFNKKIKEYNSIFIIAETASSHNGNLDAALAYVEAVSKTGADAIKFQMLKHDSLLVPMHHKYSRFKEIEFSEAQWEQIIDYSQSLNLQFIAEVFDEGSFSLAERLGAMIYKIPTSDLNNPHMVPQIAQTMKPVMLSVGAATVNEIASAIKLCEDTGNKNIVLMHGYQSFPTKIEDTNFQLLDWLKTHYSYNIGFADHIDGDSDFALVLPLVAIGYGATVIEKHITLDRSQKGPDYYSALNPDEFKKMVEMVRQVETAFGTSTIGESYAENEYRKLMKKKIVAARKISAGEKVTEKDILFRRSDEDGMVPSEFRRILGTSKKTINKFMTIERDDIEK